ncbi:hypothetical protein LJU02_00265 [Corynebacterium pseudotuberculosis]|uniref:Uncharacterized protein n=1 Tax=Corynebacterium pseudotuberculosis 258 TaxID=1168865 RepID=A0AAU8PI16_CORPS|nr:hypothetical protein [Corynebacterium pseudotuberculosis]AEQ05616.1 hypothetical protein CPCIP5297_00270 [Corynebacterium pseudotuberculosis CIP 52.97]AFB71386.1 hypothetical protein CP316_00270 [Corynebacterium pseudotuberculosis 316]AFH89889.1 hypothetical protein CP31_00265 [Corynebacterium pseudotuberculosis 31]AFK15705.1 hypothetical protein CP258_00270 [Corynebacterium pseudotuberculosis 258]AKS12396.1 Hypothetical protein CpE19_0052 [Corynebacterium pseudotuberculosis]
MKNRRQERLSAPQIISVSAILLAIGVTWTAVVFYRLNAKSIDGEWGNLTLAALGLGFGFSTLYAGVSQKKKLAYFLALGVLSSVFLLIALAYLSNAL